MEKNISPSEKGTTSSDETYSGKTMSGDSSDDAQKMSAAAQQTSEGEKESSDGNSSDDAPKRSSSSSGQQYANAPADCSEGVTNTASASSSTSATTSYPELSCSVCFSRRGGADTGGTLPNWNASNAPAGAASGSADASMAAISSSSLPNQMGLPGTAQMPQAPPQHQQPPQTAPQSQSQPSSQSQLPSMITQLLQQLAPLARHQNTIAGLQQQQQIHQAQAQAQVQGIPPLQLSLLNALGQLAAQTQAQSQGYQNNQTQLPSTSASPTTSHWLQLLSASHNPALQPVAPQIQSHLVQSLTQEIMIKGQVIMLLLSHQQAAAAAQNNNNLAAHAQGQTMALANLAAQAQTMASTNLASQAQTMASANLASRAQTIALANNLQSLLQQHNTTANPVANSNNAAECITQNSSGPIEESAHAAAIQNQQQQSISSQLIPTSVASGSNVDVHSESPFSKSRANPTKQSESSGLKDKRWMMRYDELKQFQQRYGHCRVPHGFEGNRKLSWWVMNQRAQSQLMKQGKKHWLSEDRVALLDAIGFDWKPNIGKIEEPKRL